MQKYTLNIGIIGDFEPERPSHAATQSALEHCAAHLGLTLQTSWLPTLPLEKTLLQERAAYNGFWGSPGAVYKSVAGAMAAIRFAREAGRPYFGT